MNAAVISKTPHAVPPHSIASRALGFCNENAAVAGFIVADPQEDNPKIGAWHTQMNRDGWPGRQILIRIWAPHHAGFACGAFDFHLCDGCPLTIKTNPGKSARQGRETSRNKIAHRRFCTFRTSSRHAYPSQPACLPACLPSFQALSLGAFTFNCKLSTVNLPPRPPAVQHFHRPRSPFLLSSFCLLVSSPIPSELYPFFFFCLRNLSNKYVSLLNTSTIFVLDKSYNSC